MKTFSEALEKSQNGKHWWIWCLGTILGIVFAGPILGTIIFVCGLGITVWSEAQKIKENKKTKNMTFEELEDFYKKKQRDSSR